MYRVCCSNENCPNYNYLIEFTVDIISPVECGGCGIILEQIIENLDSV